MTRQLTTPDPHQMTDHPNYTAACDELSRRCSTASSQEA